MCCLIVWVQYLGHLGNPEDTLHKTDKAILSKRLRKDISLTDAIPTNSVLITDGMAIVHKVLPSTTNTSFGEASMAVLSAVLREGKVNQRTDVGFHIYRENSIKMLSC